MDSSAEAIRDYHVNSLGWPGLAYNFLIHWDGTTEYVGDIATLRYQVAGRNHEVIGVCLPGDWTEKLPPQVALDKIYEIWDWLNDQNIHLELTTHRRIALPSSPTTCPGTALDDYVMGG